MKLLIDDANIEAIKRVYEFYPIDGVTTNPTIIAKSGRQPFDVLGEIREFIGKDADLHVQAAATSAEGIIQDAYRIRKELGDNTIIKIPCVPEGFKAMKALTKEGIRLTGTAIYTPMQAYLAAKCGASFTAPYINRIDNMGYDGVAVCKQIQDIFDTNGLNCQMLAASFKNSQQVLELCEYGIGCATVAPDIIEGFVKNAAISGAVDVFTSDFMKLTGKTSMAEL